MYHYAYMPYLHQAQCTKCICFYHYHNFHSDITLWNPLFIVNHCKCNLFITFYYLPINNSRNLLKSHVLKMASGRKCNSQIAPWNGFHSNAVCKGQKISEAIFLRQFLQKTNERIVIISALATLPVYGPEWPKDEALLLTMQWFHI